MKEGREGRVCGHREVAVRLKPNNSGEGGEGEWKGPLRTHTRRCTKRRQKVKIKRERKPKKQTVRFFFAFFFLKLSSRQWGKSGDKTGSTWVERREKWEGEGGRIQNKGN